MTHIVVKNWLAHRVQRYHTHPILGRTGQTNADHAHGVASIIALLWRDAHPELVLGALWHDAGEYGAGDMPYHVKRDNPGLAQKHRTVEMDYAMNVAPPVGLTLVDQRRLRLADSLESILFVGLHKPDLLAREDLKQQMQGVVDLAAELGVAGAVVDIIKSAQEGFIHEH